MNNIYSLSIDAPPMYLWKEVTMKLPISKITAPCFFIPDTMPFEKNVVVLDSEEKVEALFRKEYPVLKEIENMMLFTINQHTTDCLLLKVTEEIKKKEALDLKKFTEGILFNLPHENNPWLHDSRAIHFLCSPKALPFSFLPQFLKNMIGGLLMDEMTLFKLLITKTLFAVFELRDLKESGIVKGREHLDKVPSALAIIFSTPTPFWAYESHVRIRPEECHDSELRNLTTIAPKSFVSFKLFVSSLITLLRGVTTGNERGTLLLREIIESLVFLQGVLQEKGQLKIANLDTSLSRIYFDEKNPFEGKTALDYLKDAKIYLIQLKRFTQFIFEAFHIETAEIFSSLDRAKKAIDFYCYRKKGELFPRNILYLYRLVYREFNFLQKFSIFILKRIDGKGFSDIIKALRMDQWDFPTLYQVDNKEDLLEEIQSLQADYVRTLVKLFKESTDLSSNSLLRGFELLFLKHKGTVNTEECASFTQFAETIITTLIKLSDSNTHWVDDVFTTGIKRFSFMDIIEYQKIELSILKEIRLDVVGGIERFVYYSIVLIDRFDQVINPFLRDQTSIIESILKDEEFSLMRSRMDSQRIENFSKVLLGFEEFLQIADEKVQKLDQKLLDCLSLNHVSPQKLPKKTPQKNSPLKKNQISREKKEMSDPVPSIPNIVEPSQQIKEPSLPKIEESSPIEMNPISSQKREEKLKNSAQVVLNNVAKLKNHIEKESVSFQRLSGILGKEHSLKNVHWKELVKELTQAGWNLIKAHGGGHLQYRHPQHSELGRVTVPTSSKNSVSPGVVKNVREQIERSQSEN